MRITGGIALIAWLTAGACGWMTSWTGDCTYTEDCTTCTTILTWERMCCSDPCIREARPSAWPQWVLTFGGHGHHPTFSRACSATFSWDVFFLTQFSSWSLVVLNLGLQAGLAAEDCFCWSCWIFLRLVRNPLLCRSPAWWLRSCSTALSHLLHTVGANLERNVCEKRFHLAVLPV